MKVPSSIGGLGLYAEMLVAVLSSEDIAHALEWGKDGRVVRRGGSMDMRLGQLARMSGYLGGIRYYVPEVETSGDITLGADNVIRWTRDYDQDRVVEYEQGRMLPLPEEDNFTRYQKRYYQTVIHMFPSAGGLLNIGTGTKDSLYGVLKSNDCKDLRDKRSPQTLAALMAMALGVRPDSRPGSEKKNWGVNIVTVRYHGVDYLSINGKKLPKVRNIIQFFRDGVEKYHGCSPENKPSFLQKNVLLLAFIYEYFDEYGEICDFIDEFYELVKDDDAICDKCFAREDEPGNEDSQIVSEAYRVLSDPQSLGVGRTLPFTPMRPQVPYGLAYASTNRSGSKLLPIVAFSDCVEAALQSTFYCIFYDSASKKCKLNESCQAFVSPVFAGFFEKYPELDKNSKDRQEDWLRIVEDLYDDSIVYCKQRKDEEGRTVYRGEICTGLVNLLRIIVKITGLNAAEYLSGFALYRDNPGQEEEGRTIERFRARFRQAIGELCSKEILITYPCGLKMENVGQDDSKVWDITGSVEFDMKDEDGRKGVFTMVHTSKHAKLEIKKDYADIADEKRYKLARLTMEMREQLSNQLDLHLLCSFVHFICTLVPSEELDEWIYIESIQAGNHLGFTTIIPLQDDERRIKALRALFSHIVLNEDDEKTERLAENILNGLALNEDAISRSVHPLIAFNAHFREKYAAILKKHTMGPGARSAGQFAWLSDLDVQRRCVVSFSDNPELLMYLSGIDIANVLARYDAEDVLCQAVENIADADTRQKIYIYGFVHATVMASDERGQYFFSRLEISADLITEMRIQYHRRMGKFENFGFVVGFFLKAAHGASKEAVEKMYGWCFGKDYAAIYISRILPFIQESYEKVGMDFVFDHVLKARNVYSSQDGLIICASFYADLLDWLRQKGLDLRQDVAAELRDFLALSERESRAENSNYLRSASAHRKEKVHADLARLESLLESMPSAGSLQDTNIDWGHDLDSTGRA